MKLWLLLLMLFTSALSATPLRDKLTCTLKELERQDCRLASANYIVRILPKTIVLNDGTWHAVDEMPLKGEAVAWEKIQFQFLSGWPILQLWLWEKGLGESEVESLHWYVADAEKRKFTLLAEGIVRKRRLEPSEPEPPPETTAKRTKKPPRKPKYLYDTWEPHSLTTAKGGSLEWRLNAQKKTISKVLVPVPAEQVQHRSEEHT